MHDLTQQKPYYLELAWEKPRMYLRHYGRLLACVCLSHPHTVADAMRTGPGKYQFVYDFFKPMLGSGLVTSSGKRWERDHRLLLKVFSKNMLSTYISVYKNACATLVDILSDQAERTVDVSPLIKNLMFDVILQCGLGERTNVQRETDEKCPEILYNKAVDASLYLLRERLTRPWYYPDWIYFLSPSGRKLSQIVEDLRKYSGTLIHARRQELQRNSVVIDGQLMDRGRDMLDILLTVKDEDGNGLSNSEIRDQVNTFLFAGRDTTSTALQWAILHFVDHPEIQEKCRQEAVRVVENCGGLDAFGQDDLKQLIYLTQFIKENLRFTSVVPTVSRIAGKDTVIGGVSIPEGAFLNINILGLHHNRDFWMDSEKFDPDRFSPDKEPKNQYSFMPFARGARSCIGKQFAMDEMKVVLSMLLLRFRFVADPNVIRPHWYDAVVAHPLPGVNVRLEKVTV